MNELLFNTNCAEYLGILDSAGSESVFVVHEGEASATAFDPFYDANDRNIMIENMRISSTPLNSSGLLPRWQSKCESEGSMVIEQGATLSISQRLCISKRLSEI